MRIVNYINGIEGAVTGGTATVNIPVGRRYHALKVYVTADNGAPTTDPAAILDYARLLVNGVVMRDLLPADYINIAKLNGITPAASELPFYFSEPWRASVVGEESTSWDLFGQSKCTLELKFKTGLTAITCAVSASFDYGRNISGTKPFLAIVKQLKQTYNAPSGVYDVTTLPKTFPIQRILLNASTGTLNSVEVTRDNEKVQESTTAQNSTFLKDYGLAAANFSFPVVFDFEEQISSALIVNRELNVRVVSSSANTLSAIIEHRVPDYV
jgi:hypothetical protein